MSDEIRTGIGGFCADNCALLFFIILFLLLFVRPFPFGVNDL
jgi:hypothetical protein